MWRERAWSTMVGKAGRERAWFTGSPQWGRQGERVYGPPQWGRHGGGSLRGFIIADSGGHGPPWWGMHMERKSAVHHSGEGMEVGA